MLLLAIEGVMRPRRTWEKAVELERQVAEPLSTAGLVHALKDGDRDSRIIGQTAKRR